MLAFAKGVTHLLQISSFGHLVYVDLVDILLLIAQGRLRWHAATPRRFQFVDHSDRRGFELQAKFKRMCAQFTAVQRWNRVRRRNALCEWIVPFCF